MSLLERHEYNLDSIEECVDSLPAIYQAILDKAGKEDRQGFLITMVELSAALNHLKSQVDEIMQSEK